LSLSFPQNPISELPDQTREQVLQYLDFYLNDWAPTDELRREIMRAAERLIEIGIQARPAQPRDIREGLAQERVEREHQRSDRPPEP
jgi:hypothetical protein